MRSEETPPQKYADPAAAAARLVEIHAMLDEVESHIGDYHPPGTHLIPGRALRISRFFVTRAAKRLDPSLEVPTVYPWQQRNPADG